MNDSQAPTRVQPMFAFTLLGRSTEQWGMSTMCCLITFYYRSHCRWFYVWRASCLTSVNVRVFLSSEQISVFTASQILLHSLRSLHNTIAANLRLPQERALVQLMTQLLQQVSSSKILHGTLSYKTNESRTIPINGMKVRPPPPRPVDPTRA